jgi:hypothetical protein
VEAAPDEWRFLAFRGAGDRDFVGELIDPLPVRLTPGTLRVVVEPETTAVC